MENILKKKEEYIYGDLKNCVNIGYGINDKYVRCMATSIVSFCVNNNLVNFTFYVISTELSEVNKKRLEELAKMYKINIILYEINSKSINLLSKSFKWSMAIYYRVFLPMFVKGIKQLIYLDADIICIRNANDLFNIKLENEEIIGAVASIKSLSDKRNLDLNLPIEHRYFNSGVLIINIFKWNEYDVFNKFIKIIEKYDILNFPDQDALNIIMLGKVKYINRKYNYTKVGEVKKENVILRHFASRPKPWTKSWYLLLNNEDEKFLYKNYENLTPWRNTALEKPIKYNDLIIYIKLLLKNKTYLRFVFLIYKYFKKK